MRAACRLLCGLIFATALAGCASERQQLEEERSAMETRREAFCAELDRNAPVGSRWSAHRDTQKLLGEMNGADTRIREIDKQLNGW
jgi:hypothetical protein